MNPKIKIGDNVVLRDDMTKATILLHIGDKKVKIIDENGFEYIINKSELIQLEDDTNNTESYGSVFKIKDEDIKPNIRRKTFDNKSDSSGRVKIDLHIENISNYYHQMRNHEIIQLQMNFCKQELDTAMIKQKQSLEIVHGIGAGVLKSEVQKLLKLYNLTYFESQNGGSTKVML